jgi:iron complex outermembrane receptor protein
MKRNMTDVSALIGWRLAAPATLACCGLLLAQSAVAEELEEVIVTAQKRADPISKVPISITALTQEAMDSQGVRDIQDIVAQTPGLDLKLGAGNGSGMRIAIRGIDSNAGAATTGVYIDDTAVQARNNSVNFAGTSFTDVFDLERVEVLRGPQGTLFGAGAEGGVVRFITAQPSLTKYSGYSRFEASGTDHGTPSGEIGVAFGGPILDGTLGFRVSAWDRHDGGYIDRQSWESASHESKSNWEDSKVLRAAIAYAPASGVVITPSIQYQELYAHNAPSFWNLLSKPDRTEFVSGTELRQPSDDSTTLAAIKVEVDTGPVTLTSITSYFHRNNNSVADVTNTDTGSVLGPNYAFPVAPDGSIYTVTSLSTATQKVITQELRLQNSDANAKIKWLAGAFYSQAKLRDTLMQPALKFPALFDQINGPGAFVNYFGSGLLDGIYEYTGDERSTDKQLAVFGNVDYRFAADWILTAGVRVAQTKVSYSIGENGPEGPLANVLVVSQGEQKDNPVTPKIGVSWQPSDHNMFYASVSKGYRIGGVNDGIPAYCGADAQATAKPTYQSDSTVSYEVGAKSRPAGGKLQIDASVFHIDWNNIQQYLIFPCLYGYNANSGKARSDGFDLSVNAKLAQGLLVGGSVGYTNAKYTNTTLAPSGAVVTSNGQTLGQTPWTLFGFVEYSFTVFTGRDAYVRAQEKYDSKNRGEFGYQNTNSFSYDPLQRPNDASSELDLRTGLKVGGLDLSLFVNNVTNRAALFYSPVHLNGSSLRTEFTLRPRTLGLTGVYRF